MVIIYIPTSGKLKIISVVVDDTENDRAKRIIEKFETNKIKFISYANTTGKYIRRTNGAKV